MSGTASGAAALGWGLKLAPVDPIDGAGGGLDLEFGAVVEGPDALLQSLTLALVTLQGADVFNTRFGFIGLAAISEETEPVLRRERLRLAVIGVLQAEPRVRRVITVRFADEAAEAGYDTAPPPPVPQAVPPPRQVSIEAQFETIAGTTQAITIGGQVLDVR